MKPNDVYMSGEFYFMSYSLAKHTLDHYYTNNKQTTPYSSSTTTTTVTDNGNSYQKDDVDNVVMEKHEDLIIGTMVMESTRTDESQSSSQLKLINIRNMDSLWIHDYQLTKTIDGFTKQYHKNI